MVETLGTAQADLDELTAALEGSAADLEDLRAEVDGLADLETEGTGTHES